jgi:glycosyltransferase involved in cell wall biosynthesis
VKLVTVLLPCYNEADAIADVIAHIPTKGLEHAGFNVDILVVDNNSIDNTAAIAKAAGARVIHESKQGKGYGIKTGFYNLLPDTDYVVMLDGDYTYKGEEILRLLEPLDCDFASVIIGSRMHGRMQTGAMKRFNYLGNRAFSRLVRTSYHVMVSDALTGYMAWTRQAVEELRPHLESAGFTIEMEMITKLARLGYGIYSVPISYNPRVGSSSLRPLQDGTRIFATYARYISWQPTPRLSRWRRFKPAWFATKSEAIVETER